MNIVSLPTPHLNSFGWLCWLLNDLDVFTSSTTPIYNDNQSAIHVACNDVFPKQTRYIKIDCHLAWHHLLKEFSPIAFVLFSRSACKHLYEATPYGSLSCFIWQTQVGHLPPSWRGAVSVQAHRARPTIVYLPTTYMSCTIHMHDQPSFLYCTHMLAYIKTISYTILCIEYKRIIF